MRCLDLVKEEAEHNDKKNDDPCPFSLDIRALATLAKIIIVVVLL
ncbi:hypothetical protein [Sulfurisphaera ohwakuensis]|uniref:Uncharacterized protein n=1 Tax=Sulfurisphaera ohwakuensis TaxID=69656 RepID=A0A7J9RTZ1_SULOH|nr:hypothetical protein [Sulfurisphaera ohwakuensis]MBB5254301.1 hypothetical protein [Sulfurisphaera ohwakuensis]